MWTSTGSDEIYKHPTSPPHLALSLLSTCNVEHDILLNPAMSFFIYSHAYVQQDPRKGTFSTVFLCNNHNLKATLVINGRGDKYILVCSYNGKPNINNKETIWNEKQAMMTGNNMDVLH